MTDAAALGKAVEKSPEDNTLKSALADCLRESGSVDEATVVQWCVQFKRWPERRKKEIWEKGPLWRWWGRGRDHQKPKKQGTGLPPPIVRVMDSLEAESAEQAIQNLTNAFIYFRDNGPKWN